jgi:hypothetical protein
MIPSDDEQRAARIAKLNDQVRKHVCIPSQFIQRENPHRIVMTRGVSTLPPETQFAAYALIRDFADFTEDNDPYGEHDFGSIEHDGHKLFWKFDYYDHQLEHGSENPDDPAQSCRVLTVMLAEEY